METLHKLTLYFDKKACLKQIAVEKLGSQHLIVLEKCKSPCQLGSKEFP